MRRKFAQYQMGEVLAAYTAYLRALALIHQNAHWQTKGKEFYSNHLLFERLYKSVSEDSDKIAEKTVGLSDSSFLNLAKQVALIKEIANKYVCVNFTDCPANSLKAEEEFLKLSKTVQDKLNQDGSLSLGLNNLIEELASNSEERVYLLKQIG